jgi:hypothetical protein
MGSVIDFGPPRRRRTRVTVRPPTASTGATVVQCGHCNEPHPIVRLQGGEQRCVTAFFDGANWFCRNRGCRRAWLERSGEI